MVLRAGKSFDVDSEDERLLPGEGSSGSKHKKHRTSLQSNLGRPPLTPVVHSDTPAPAGTLDARPTTVDAAIAIGLQQPLDDGRSIGRYDGRSVWRNDIR
jgi:hypothetical protein